MSAPTSAVVQKYVAALTDIRDRLSRARQLLASSDTSDIESAALQVRLALEAILYSGLLTHRDRLRAVTKSLARAKPTEARKKVEEVNPNWWPKPQDVTPGGSKGIAVTLAGHHDDDFMTAEGWGRSFGQVSEVLHAPNPLSSITDLASTKAELEETVDRLWRLLGAHTLDVGVPGYLLVGRFDEANVEVGVLKKVSEAPPEE